MSRSATGTEEMYPVPSPIRPRPVPVLALITALLLIVLAGLGPLAAAPAVDTIVRCEPELIVGQIGAPVSFTIFVDDVADLYGADVRLSFDPSVAQVVDANPGKGGTQIEILDAFLSPDYVLRDRADNVAGTIWYANTQINPSPPVAGSGALARVTLQPLKAGGFDMPITNADLANGRGETLPANARDCRVTFLDPNTTSKTYLPVSLAP
jgi:hypothetical protein